jgi:hypothetical protein
VKTVTRRVDDDGRVILARAIAVAECIGATITDRATTSTALLRIISDIRRHVISAAAISVSLTAEITGVAATPAGGVFLRLSTFAAG